MPRHLRRSAEYLSRPLVLRRRLGPPFGDAHLYVSTAGGLKYLYKPISAVDPRLLACAAELVKPDDVVWDVGANLGLFAVAAAHRAGLRGRVFAFEPDVSLVALLRRSARIQPATSAPIAVIPAAVARNVALRPFAIAARARAANALAEYGLSQMGGVSESQLVPAFNLDWLLTTLPAPDVLKVDVEGAEIEVILDQVAMFDDVRPVLICEICAEATDPLTQFLTSRRYRLYDADRSLKQGDSVGRATWNTVAVPEEALHQRLTA